MPTLLAVAYGGGHITMVLPVLAQLREIIPGLDIELLALTTARAQSRGLGLRCIGYTELLAQWPDEEAVRQGKLLLSGNSHPDVTADESVAYLGLNWVELVRQHGEQEARRRFSARGRASFYPLELMRRLIADRRPDFVLTTNSPRTEQAAVEAAVELGVPCLSMFDLFPVPDDPYALRPVNADITTVISGRARDTLVLAGMRAEKIAVTGNPAFDALASPALAAEGWARILQLGWERSWVVLYAGYAESTSHGRWLAGTAFPLAIERVLRAFVDSHDDVALVIRQHPNNWHLFEQEWAQQLAHPRIHISRPGLETLEPWLLACNAVVVQASTVGLQAAIAGKPVLSMDESPSIVAASFSWSALGIAKGVGRVEDLAHELTTLRACVVSPITDIPSPAAPSVAALIARRLQ